VRDTVGIYRDEDGQGDERGAGWCCGAVLKQAIEVSDEGIQISPCIQVSVSVRRRSGRGVMSMDDMSFELFGNEARLQFLSVFGRDKLETSQGQEGRNKMSRRTHGFDTKVIARDKERLG
jgi:hypothetical protein